MQVSALLQTGTNAIGGSPLVVILVLLGLLLTAGLSLVVAYLVIRGYRRNRNRSRLYLAIGLVLLTAGPIVIQLVLSNLTTMSQIGRSAAANASKLLGLGAMLYAIYGVTRPRTTTKRKRDSDRSDEVRK
jgi:drug/metabolite transporter (DMT)-like permease